MNMDTEVSPVMAECGEARDTDEVSVLLGDGGAQRRNGVAVSRVVAELVEDVRDDDRLARAGVHDEAELPGLSRAVAPNVPGYEDELVAGVEPGDFHRVASLVDGQMPLRPVQNDPTSS